MGLRPEHGDLGAPAGLLSAGRASRLARFFLAGALAAACRPEPARTADSAGRLYVTSGLTDEVIRLDATDGTIVARHALDRRRAETDEPHGVAVSPDGRHWYATLAHGEPTLWKYELAGDRLVGRVDLGLSGSGQIGLTPDGRRAFIPDYQRAAPDATGRVAVVELEDLRVVASPTVCPGPHEAAVDPARRAVAVACTLGDEVVLLDAADASERGRFPVDPRPGSPGSPRFRPINLAWGPDGSALYVSLHDAAEVRAFDPEGRPLGSVPVGRGPAQVDVSRDGRLLVVANRHDRSMSVVSLPGLRETRRVDVGAGHPHGVVLSPDARTAYVACEGSVETPGRVVAVDVERGAVLWSVAAGSFLLDIAYAEGG